MRIQARSKENVHPGSDTRRDQVRIRALTPLEGVAYKLMGETKRHIVRSGNAIERENTASNLGLKKGRGGSDGESHD